MIIILDINFNKLGIIKNAIKSERYEEINGENILNFSAILDEKLNSLINQDSIFEVDNDYFDISYLKKNANEDGSFTIDVEAEHISYRLNQKQYDLEFFTEHGSPWFILEQILQGTGFNIWGVHFFNSETYSIQEKISRRQLLMNFVNYLKAEIIFNGWSITLIPQRGQNTNRIMVKDKNIKVLSKSLNKKELDDNDNYLISYECEPIYLPGDNYSLGDKILLIQNDINISEELRIVNISYDIYDRTQMTFLLGNYINGIEKNLFRIITESIIKDKFYNNIRIGPRYGFEAIRNDKKTRAIFNSIDGIRLQKGDGLGGWTDQISFNLEGNAVIKGETEDGFTRITPEGIQVFDNLGQLHVFLGQFLPDRFGLQVRGNNQNTIIDEYGINPDFVKKFPNKIINSGFEKFESLPSSTLQYPGKPLYWIGDGLCTAWSSFEGDVGLELKPGQSIEQGMVDQFTHAGADPDWWSSQKTRISFRQKGGKVRVWVKLVANVGEYWLTNDNITPNISSFSLDFDFVDNWENGLRTFIFYPLPNAGKVNIKIQNISPEISYIDAVQIEPDFNGKWPSFYTPGPKSEAEQPAPRSLVKTITNKNLTTIQLNTDTFTEIVRSDVNVIDSARSLIILFNMIISGNNFLNIRLLLNGVIIKSFSGWYDGIVTFSHFTPPLALGVQIFSVEASGNLSIGFNFAEMGCLL